MRRGWRAGGRQAVNKSSAGGIVESGFLHVGFHDHCDSELRSVSVDDDGDGTDHDDCACCGLGGDRLGLLGDSTGVSCG